ncbi:MAG: YceI family protein [Flavobacteriales bacterium]|nr:YceI family protein [Flavobacteriales bacterium]
MKKVALTLMFAVVAMLAFATGVDGEAKTLSVNTKSSSMNWKGSKVTGSHAGVINIADGSISMDGNAITSAKVNIDMTSIVCTDADMNDEYKGKLIGHLSSPDFFNVAEYNTATFNLTKFKAMAGKDGYNYQITGDLTIKGITKEITFPAKVTMDGNSVRVESKVTIDRTRWDIKYGSGKFFDSLGDNLIYDDLEIGFVLVANA